MKKVSESEPHNLNEQGWGTHNILIIDGKNMEEYLEVAKSMITENVLLKINTCNILREVANSTL